MKAPTAKPSLRCAIYTRVSTDARLEQEFNSLDAQWEASEAYIKSQTHEGWTLVRARYDDGGFSGGSMERPALPRLLLEVQAKRIDVIVVYKVDRLTRSLADFAKLVELFDAYGVSFVSVTQSFNTTTSMGRLTLNVLLSFAQFERSEGARPHLIAKRCASALSPNIAEIVGPNGVLFRKTFVSPKPAQTASRETEFCAQRL
jgi:site-specific DNA recombinase